MSGANIAADPQALLAQRQWVRRLARALVAGARRQITEKLDALRKDLEAVRK